jgi:hypothetical protein
LRIAAERLCAREFVGTVVGKDRDLLAILFEPTLAIRANSAGIHHAAHCGEIARFEFRYFAADGGDTADDFMPWNNGINRVVPFIAGLMEIGVADAAEQNLDRDIRVGWFSALDRKGRKRRSCRQGCVRFGHNPQMTSRALKVRHRNPL